MPESAVSELSRQNHNQNHNNLVERRSSSSPNNNNKNCSINNNPLSYAQIENKRIRNMFNTKQIEILERVFEQTHYPDSTMREQLSASLNLNVIRIQVWFQNRRAKYKKMDSADRNDESNVTGLSSIKRKFKVTSKYLFFEFRFNFQSYSHPWP